MKMMPCRRLSPKSCGCVIETISISKTCLSDTSKHNFNVSLKAQPDLVFLARLALSLVFINNLQLHYREADDVESLQFLKKVTFQTLLSMIDSLLSSMTDEHLLIPITATPEIIKGWLSNVQRPAQTYLRTILAWHQWPNSKIPQYQESDEIPASITAHDVSTNTDEDTVAGIIYCCTADKWPVPKRMTAAEIKEHLMKFINSDGMLTTFPRTS
jgi:hypothetical protein